MNGVTLRPATGADEPFLRELFRSTLEPLLRAMPLDERGREVVCDMQFRAQAASYRNAFAQAEYLVVCDAGARPIGRLTRAWDGDALVLVDIALVPEVRGRGIGTSLVRAMQQEARSRGAAVLLNVEGSNPALRLYRRMGFGCVGDDGMRLRMRWLPVETLEEEGEGWIRTSER
ncbi:MAG TPA: GNAT family N-acetyltransferase [Usitatibacter sp.]|jgi:ribosomal protein S18 acetylase RimI-like enzyme|nr:GNAT family N-acetyltransferase [Usitatibacter sp.]